jgi:non-heme chloroperoxidase
MVTPNIKFAKLSTGVKLQFAEQGDRTGIPVIFLHGLSDSWYSFKLVLSSLPNSIHAFSISQRGHGDSGRPKQGYSYNDFSADLEAFMDSLHIEKAFIAGHSSPGTTAAQRFAIDCPERTIGLILISPFMANPNSQLGWEFWGSFVSKLSDPIEPELVRQFQAGTFTKPLPKDFFETIIKESLKVPSSVWKAVVKNNLEKEDFSEELVKIKAPTLLIWGEKDEMVPPDEQNALRSAILNSRVLIYEGIGHGVHWEAPERFTSDLLDFIKRVNPN